MKLRDDALTPVVSAAIALLIVTSTVGTVVMWGVPYTNDLRNKSASENVKGQMDTLSKDINDLVNSNPGDKKIDTFSMDGGTISTSTKADRTVIMYSHSKDYEFTVTNIIGNNVFIRMIKPFNYPFNYTLDDARLSWSTCFLAGTKVLMADGSYKNIEDITVGEQVASYSEYTNTIESGFVSNVFHHSSNEMPDYYIIINDGLKVTPNHRFYSDGKWVFAGNLKIGDTLFSYNRNTEYIVYSIGYVFEKEPCFDLEVELYHTYFVSMVNDGVDVLVHNPYEGKNEPPSAPENPQPPNHATDVPIDVILEWSPCKDPEGGEVFYEVYFGEGGKLEGHELQEYTWFDPGILNYNVEYWWKVIAYDEQGNPAEGEMWDFTTQENPNNPPSAPIYSSPSNHATNVNTITGLFWNCSDPDGDILTYDVYLGKSTPPTLTRSDWPYNSLSLLGLEFNTKYYWKIVAKDEHGATTAGPIWDFTTQVPANNPPNVPTYLHPTNHETNVNIDLYPYYLNWTCGDPNGDQLNYDIYFGDTSPPPLYESYWPYQFYDPTHDIGHLEFNTKYYWRIVARDIYGATTTGPIWDFTTEGTNNPPNTPNYLTPPNHATNVTLDLCCDYLTWTCSDPDGDQLNYDIYFGMTNPPPLRGDHWEDTQYDPFWGYGSGPPNTTFYWRIVARDNWGWTTSGPTWDYTTMLTVPHVDTNNAINVADNTATLVGEIRNTGGDVCQVRFKYSPNNYNNIQDFIEADDSHQISWIYPSDWHGSYNINEQVFSEGITGLNGSTNYVFRAGAKNSIGEDWGGYEEIAREKSITVISPNGGEVWLVNNTYNIIWTSQGIEGNIYIYLWEMGGMWGNYIVEDIPNTGSYQWHIQPEDIEGAYHNDRFRIRIVEYGMPGANDMSDGNFSICPMGTGVFTLNATEITSTTAKLNGILVDISGQVRFKYRVIGNQSSWTYTSYWHGNYDNESFYESIYSLSPGLTYEYQAGVKILDFELWGNSSYFSTYLHEGTNNIKPITPEHVVDDNWLLNLSSYIPSPIPLSEIVVLDLYAIYPTKERFGTIWIYDSNSLIYMQSNNGESEGYAFEKGGILRYEEGKWHVEDTTQISNWTNLFSIHVPQTIFSSFSESASSNAVLKFKIYSSLQSSYTGESKQIYNMRIQFDGDHKYEWRDYLKGKYLFEDDTVPTEYPSLKYVPSENGVCLALAYSTINLVLN